MLAIKMKLFYIGISSIFNEDAIIMLERLKGTQAYQYRPGMDFLDILV